MPLQVLGHGPFRVLSGVSPIEPDSFVDVQVFRLPLILLYLTSLSITCGVLSSQLRFLLQLCVAGAIQTLGSDEICRRSAHHI